jgi:excisionase family DNA binding protein
MRHYSTAQVAKMLGLHQPNLQRLIREKRIPFPQLQRLGKLRIRLWTPKDVKRAREALRKK